MNWKVIWIMLLFFSFHKYTYSQTKIISTGDDWLYYDNEAPLPNDWYNNAANDEWRKGSSPLGYGDSIVRTTLSYGTDAQNKHITKYFKKSFYCEDPYTYLIYKLNVQRDDGIVVYLNGREILRNNMPDGVVTDSTAANSLVFNSKNELIKHTKLLSPEDFVVGLNTISASVHQARKISSDCLFNLELEGSNDAEMIPLLLKEQTIKNLNLDLKLKDLNHSQELEKKHLLLEFAERSKNNMRLFLIIMTLLLFSTVGFLLNKWRQFSRREKVLNDTIVELKNINQHKDREMMNISLGAINEKQVIKGIKKSLEQSISVDSKTEISNTVKRIVKDIDFSINSDEDWENLKKHFNVVHNGYVDKLKKRHPLLTDVEIRHCIFMKLHMQTKEIAGILHIDPKSVQVSRYRLKKKMNLDEATDLKDYLLGI